MKNTLKLFISKFYETVIIVLAVFLLLAITALGIQSWRVNHFKSEFTLLDAKYKTEVAVAKTQANKQYSVKFPQVIDVTCLLYSKLKSDILFLFVRRE